MAGDSIKDLRRRVYLTLEQGPIGGGVGIWIDRFLVTLILMSTPERSCIGSPERICINDRGKKAPELGAFS